MTSVPRVPAALSHDSSVWPRYDTREEEEAAFALSRCFCCCCVVVPVCLVWDHGRFKASWAADWERAAPLAAGTVGRDAYRARRRGRLLVEPPQDEGEERNGRAENARRQRQSRAGPGRLRTSLPWGGEHGNVNRIAASFFVPPTTICFPHRLLVAQARSVSIQYKHACGKTCRCRLSASTVKGT